MLKTSWILQNIALNSQIFVFLVYWTYLAPKKEFFSFFSIHTHGILLLVTIISTIVFCFPIKLIHFIFTLVFCYAYFLTTFIAHITETNSAIYGSLTDWNYPLRTAALGILMATFSPLIIHTICFFIYKYKRLQKVPTVNPESINPMN